VNYYMVLGIGEDADGDTIRSAFRAMVRRYHPDAGEGSSSDAFRRVVEAYETLNDPARRRVYDRALHPHAVHPPRMRERFVEPLSNLVEPLETSRFRTVVGYRRPAHFVQSQVDVDDLLNAVVDCFDAFWSLSGRRRF
jgi:DnaJ-class molecular chaperone